MSIMDKVKKKLKKDQLALFHTGYSQIEGLKSGSIVINKLSGIGGYPKGRITEIFGPESSGKTTLAYHAIKTCQAEGKVAIFVDYEKTFDSVYSSALGVQVNEEKLLLLRPKTLEEGSDILKAMLSDPEIAPDIGLVVIDSIAAMQPAKIIDGSAEQESIGLQARKLATFFAWYATVTEENEITSIFLNQERTNIKTSPFDTGPDVKSTGGKALQYYISFRLRLRIRKADKEKRKNPATGVVEDVSVKNFVRVECKKSKVGFPGLRADIVIRYGKGIDNFLALLEIAKGNGQIEQAGPMYRFTSLIDGEEKKFKGWANVEKFFIENRNELGALKDWFENKSIEMEDEDNFVDIYDDSEHLPEASVEGSEEVSL